MQETGASLPPSNERLLSLDGLVSEGILTLPVPPASTSLSETVERNEALLPPRVWRKKAGFMVTLPVSLTLPLGTAKSEP